MSKKLFVVLPIFALLLTGCDVEDMGSWGPSDRFKEDFHFSYKLKAGSPLSIDNFNGSIEITSWEKDEVEVNGTKYAGSEELLRQVKIEADSKPDSLRLRTVRPEGMRGNMGAKYILRVPKKVLLSGIVSSNGSIRVDGTEGDARLQSSNGSIRVMRLDGNLEARTSNSSIEATGVNGNFVGQSSNGSIKVDGLRGAFEGVTSNSSIVARVEKLAAGKMVKAKSSNGSIELVLPDYAGQEIDAESSNSSVTLRLPKDANAELRASTSNGKISSDFEVTTTGELSKSRLEGRIGKGGGLIRMNSSNGSLRLETL